MLRLSQPVPRVSAEDVERIARRDFKPEEVAEVLQELARCLVADNAQTQARVQLAVLKLAAGDVDRLRLNVGVAIIDFRDVVAPAESPRYLNTSPANALSWLARSRIYTEDWNEYKAWLSR